MQSVKDENYIPAIEQEESLQKNNEAIEALNKNKKEIKEKPEKKEASPQNNSTAANTIIIDEQENDEETGQEEQDKNASQANYNANYAVNSSTITLALPSYSLDKFKKKETQHFILYEEKEASDEFANNAEDIYKKLNAKMPKFMLQPRAGKVSIYLARTSQTLPQFNKAHSLDTIYDILENKKIYIYKNSNYYGMLAHEITHYYFGSFFTVQNPAPYWLMEGLSIYMQIELAGKKSMPDWFDEYQGKISRGTGFSYKVLSVIDDIEGAEEDSIRIWLAQSYSLAKYLIELKGMDTFYSFCDHLKQGYTDENAFYYVYGKTSRKIEQSWLISITDPDYLKGIIKSRQNNKIGYWKK